MSTKSLYVRHLTITGLLAALICVLGPISLPIGPVPISLGTLAIYITLYLADWKWASASVITYILVGAAGLPVFSGFSGGLGKLAGPTGGYIVGYIFLAIIAGYAVSPSKKRITHLAGLLIGTAVLYAFGTAWFCCVTDMPIGQALEKCVWIFIPGDLLKIAVAMSIGPVIRRRIDESSRFTKK